MALKSTIHRIQLSVANIPINHYEDYNLTLARHPSETDERLMCRLLAFALHADHSLEFGKGLSEDAEPDLWLKTLDGRINNWIDLGQPDEKRLRQCCGKAEQVHIYCYQQNAAQIWWEKLSYKTQTLPHLKIRRLDVQGDELLSSLVQRTMQIGCTIQDEEILVTGEPESGPISINVEVSNFN